MKPTAMRRSATRTPEACPSCGAEGCPGEERDDMLISLAADFRRKGYSDERALAAAHVFVFGQPWHKA